VRAFDGTDWSAWDSFNFTTLPNTPPVVAVFESSGADTLISMPELPAITVLNPIEGTAENDVLTGTAANDLFVFKPNFGNDSIVNFQPGQDYIEIDHTIFADATTLLAHTADDVHGNAVITADQANTITFHDVSTEALKQHVSDFFLV
jgi:Ca2+-binding RTX toxin-like protein